MKVVSVLGANGFIGSRLVEILHLENLAEVRPVVRTPASAARLSRFSLDCRVADAQDESALVAAFSGCDTVVHAISGSPEVIIGALEPAYRAAEKAKVRLLVYLSSAAVHGQAPEPGTDEQTPLSDKQVLPYNNAKVRAEGILGRLRRQGTVDLVILRPGIVFGPRSFWVGSFADALLAGNAYLIGNGEGICNSIYVDNLVHAIRLAMSADKVDGEAFLLGDREKVTWFDLYQPIAKALGFDLNSVTRVPALPAPERQNHLELFRRTSAARVIRAITPSRIRRALSARLSHSPKPPVRQPPSPWQCPTPPAPQATLEMSLLFSCRYKLPYEKAKRLLGYEPGVTFQEAIRRTIGWMQFAGYPIA